MHKKEKIRELNQEIQILNHQLNEWMHASKAQNILIDIFAEKLKIDNKSRVSMMSDAVIIAAQEDERLRHTDLILTALENNLI